MLHIVYVLDLSAAADHAGNHKHVCGDSVMTQLVKQSFEFETALQFYLVDGGVCRFNSWMYRHGPAQAPGGLKASAGSRNQKTIAREAKICKVIIRRNIIKVYID